MAQIVSENALHLMFARQFWQDIEVLSRSRSEKALHAFAKKAIKELGREMVDIAKEEIFSDDDDDDEISKDDAKRLLKEESDLSDTEKLEREAILNSFADKLWGGDNGW